MADDAEPVACSLDSEELKSRQGSLLPGLAAHVRAINETPNGYEFELSASREILGQLYEVIAADRSTLDITRVTARYLSDVDIVVNCAAWTDVDGAQTNAAAAEAVNGTAVGTLSRACVEAGAASGIASTQPRPKARLCSRRCVENSARFTCAST